MRIALFLALALSNAAHAATFLVDTTSDANLTACTVADGDCSLRGAIANTTSSAGADTVAFNIPMSDPGCVAASGVCTLQPGTPLPVPFGGSGNGVLVDGTTQPGWQANSNTPEQGGLNTQLKIVLSGMACANCTGLYFGNHDSALRGLVIHGFNTHVQIGASGVLIEGNFIGTDVSGSVAAAAPNSNRTGIGFDGNPNGGEGVTCCGRIGGTLPAQRNLISGHNDRGMVLTGFAVSVLGNLIGTNASGTAAIPNRTGVFANGGHAGASAFQYFIGNGTELGRNVISGNSQDGILFAGQIGLMHDARVQGNYIGTDISGELPLGNGLTGITQSNGALATDTAVAALIGGLVSGQGNRIAFNSGAGILIGINPKTAIVGNSFSRNGAFGINIQTGLRHPNDVGDIDAGAGNNLQNFPEISSFALGSTADLSYRVDSTITDSAYPLRVEFFKADGDEGRDFLGAHSYEAAQAHTIQPVSLVVPAGVSLGADDVIVATATDANGNTSEFSFLPATLSVQTPLASACLSSDGVFCNGLETVASPSLKVRVVALASAGPFAPNGVVGVSDNRGATCTLTLRPTGTPLTSAGDCILVNSGAPGSISITALLRTASSAFASASGGDVSGNGNFTIP